MGDFFIGEIRAVAFAQPLPHGWAECNGQLLTIAQNQALYTLLGTQFGGDGKTSFALPDLRGRTVLGFGVGPATAGYAPNTFFKIGAKSGTETVVLTAPQIPPHTHQATATKTVGDTLDATNAIMAAASPQDPDPVLPIKIYAPVGTTPVPLNSGVVSSTGVGAAHNNMQPYLTLRYIIAMTGLYPTRPN